MAGEAPDPKTFRSWEEAFQYPLPAVRGMERQLRRDIEANKERLRSLVGASYRDLLGTAETVIEMDQNMRQVEAHLGGIGRRCNTRILERKSVNLSTWEEEVDSDDYTRNALASQLSVLRNCPDAISRLLKNRGSILLAAKVLVISRLLHTKLSKNPTSIPFLESLRNRLAALRRRLLARIDRRFRSLGVANDALLEAMSAFALATSSSPADVLMHFHFIRAQEIADFMKPDLTSKKARILRALHLYVATLKDTQVLFPAQLSNMLVKLKKAPLLKDQQLYNMEGLDIDIHEFLLGDDITSFTPYVRHEDLHRTEAERLLKAWARVTVDQFLVGLRRRIKDLEDPNELVGLRNGLLELWLSQRQTSLGINPAETLDRLRDAFNEQSVQVIKSRVLSLKEVGVQAGNTLKDWRDDHDDSNSSLWSVSMVSIDTTNGGRRLRQEVMERLSGKDNSLKSVLLRYANWLQGVRALEDMILQIRSAKWDDYEDGLDDNDQDLLDNKQVLLGQDDPRILEEELSATLGQAYDDLQAALRPDKVETNLSPLSGSKAVFLLRLWRQLRESLPKSCQTLQLGIEFISELQITVASAALESPLRSCTARLATLKKSGKFATRPLWEGGPELPVLPSPWAYRLLLRVEEAMTKLGPDIWSPTLATILKKTLDRRLSRSLRSEVEVVPKPADEDLATHNGNLNGESLTAKEKAGEASKAADDGEKGEDENAMETTDVQTVDDEDEKNTNPSSKVNGAVTNGDAVSAPQGLHDQDRDRDLQRERDNQRDRRIQRLFDVLYLVNATKISTQSLSSLSADQQLGDGNRKADNESESTEAEGEGERLVDLAAKLEADLQLESKAVERLRRDAADYWKRTRLLMGLL